MKQYFKPTELDKRFWEKNLKDRLPDTIYDVHQHMGKEEMLGEYDEEMVKTDWALECGVDMTVEDYSEYSKVFYPGKKVLNNAFGLVLRNAHHKENNEYLAKLYKEKKIHSAFMVLNPNFDPEYVEKCLVEDGFNGFKPYADMVSGKKGGDISFPDFMPDELMKVLNKHKKCLMLHIPRAGRIADDDNIREMKELKMKYPDIKIIIAHFGRGYSTGVFDEGMKKLGSDVKEFYFDASGVLNPAVLEKGFGLMDPNKVMYGTDLPVFLWHGKRQWTDRTYQNLCREDFYWNKHIEGPEKESEYTFFLYEQMNNLLNVLEKFPDGKERIEKFFYKNALNIVG